MKTYIDDVIIFSKDESQHKEHLNLVFQKIQDAGLTLQDKKYHIGMDKVFYLGHTFLELEEGQSCARMDYPT